LGGIVKGTLKNERVHRTQYPTREHARIDITRYIEFRYNRIRLHSTLGYKTPDEVEWEWFEEHCRVTNRNPLSGKCRAPQSLSRLTISPCWPAPSAQPLRRRLTGYHNATPDTLQRRFLSITSTSTSTNTITVRLNRRTYSPILRPAAIPDTTIPWWGNRTLHFEYD